MSLYVSKLLIEILIKSHLEGIVILFNGNWFRRSNSGCSLGLFFLILTESFIFLGLVITFIITKDSSLSNLHILD